MNTDKSNLTDILNNNPNIDIPSFDEIDTELLSSNNEEENINEVNNNVNNVNNVNNNQTIKIASDTEVIYMTNSQAIQLLSKINNVIKYLEPIVNVLQE
jgi:hypothetical protein